MGSSNETFSFKAWNKVFQRLKLILKSGILHSNPYRKKQKRSLTALSIQQRDLLLWKKIRIFELYQKREQLRLTQNYREFPKASKPYCMPNWMNTTEADPLSKRQEFIWWCCPDRENPTTPFGSTLPCPKSNRFSIYMICLRISMSLCEWPAPYFIIRDGASFL